MKVFAVYKLESDHARLVSDWLRDFTRQTGKVLEEVNPETREGEAFCRTYDIVEYPSLVAVDNTKSLQMLWRGTMLPTIGEVSYYVQDN